MVAGIQAYLKKRVWLWIHPFYRSEWLQYINGKAYTFRYGMICSMNLRKKVFYSCICKLMHMNSDNMYIAAPTQTHMHTHTNACTTCIYTCMHTNIHAWVHAYHIAYHICIHDHTCIQSFRLHLCTYLHSCKTIRSYMVLLCPILSANSPVIQGPSWSCWDVILSSPVLNLQNVQHFLGSRCISLNLLITMVG